MTDQFSEGPTPTPSAPDTSPLPIPVPAGPPQRSYRGLIITAAVLLVVLLISACVVAAPQFGSFAGDMFDFGQMRWATGTTGAWWSGDGQWVFTQSSDARGVSTIVAIRPSDSTTRTLEGYWLLAIEPTGSRARVIADPKVAPFDMIGRSADPSATLAAADAAIVSPGSLDDLPGTRTLVWDPERGGEPTDEAWAAHVPAAGVKAAFFTSAHGAYPARIILTHGTRKTVIQSTRTMQQVGWSRSLRYYAAVELAPVQGLSQDEGDEEYTESGRIVIVRVWDTETSSEVASAVVDPGIETKFVWSPVEDALYWTDRGRDDEPINVVRVLRPDHGPEAVPLSSRDASSAPFVVGTDSHGVLLRMLTSGSDEETSSESSGGNPTHRHLAIGAGSEVTARGSDSMRAVFTEVGPRGVLWWHPALPASEDARVAISASGITVWLSGSIDTTPSVLFRGGIPDSMTTD